MGSSLLNYSLLAIRYSRAYPSRASRTALSPTTRHAAPRLQHRLERHPRPGRRAAAEIRIGVVDAARDVAPPRELGQDIGGLPARRPDPCRGEAQAPPTC